MTPFRQQQAKRLTFVFLVLTLVSSLSAAAFVTSTMNLAFAKKSSGGGGGNKNKGGGSSSGDKGGSGGSGSGDNGGGGSSSETGGGGSSGSSDTGSTTSTPPSTTEETTPPPPTTEGSTTSSPPPAGENQQKTCPDGSQPDENGKCPPTTSTEQNTAPPPTSTEQSPCPDGSTPDPTTGNCPSPASNPTTTLTPNQGTTTTTTTPAAQDGAHILVMSNPDGSCPAGSHKFPGSQVCEKDTAPSASGSGGGTGGGNTGTTTTTTPPTQPDGTNTGTTTPATTQGGHILVMSNPDGSCPAGSHKFPGSQVCEKDTPNPTTSGGGQVPPECQGIIAGPSDKCSLGTSASPATSPIKGATQTLTEQTTHTPGTTSPVEVPVSVSTPVDKDGKCPSGNPPLGGACLDKVKTPGGICPRGTHGQGGGCTSDEFPNIAGGCIAGRHLDAITSKCIPDNNTPTQTTPASQQTCPDASAPDKNGNCALFLKFPPTSPTASGCDSEHPFFDPGSNKCYKGGNFDVPPCPGAKPDDGGGGHDVYGICNNPKTGFPQGAGELTDGTCSPAGVHIGNFQHRCIYERSGLDPDGSCPTGYVQVDEGKTPCGLRIHDPLKDGSCPPNYSPIGFTKLCKRSSDTSSGFQVDELPGGYCPVGYTHMGTQCSAQLPVLPGSSTGQGGGIIPMFPTVPANKDGSCPAGSHNVGSSGNAGQPGTGSITCVSDTSKANALPTNTPTTQTGTGGGAGTTTTPTNTGNPNTTPPTTTPSTSTSTTTNVINGGGPSGSGGGAGGGTATPAQGSNAFLTYVNTFHKITMKYPSSWTKTDLVGNPRIPVMFSAPTITTTTSGAGAAKTSFVISITPGAANLDSFTQQQINGLTQSNAVKYTITDSNAKVLTPPTGITAFREISYDGIKNNLPLKGAAIFFVNGGTGYGLLYLAKQTDYTQNIPVVQQMVNSFQVGGNGPSASSNGGAGVQNVAAATSR